MSADGAVHLARGRVPGRLLQRPMAQINDYYFEDLTPEILGQIIDDFRAGKSPKAGS